MSTPQRFRDLALAAKLATIKRRTGAYHRELLTNQRRDPEMLVEQSRAKALALARFAAAETAFYRRHFGAAGLSADALHDAGCWEDLPVVERADLKAHHEEFHSSEASPATIRHGLTSGSTGEPLQTVQDARVPGFPAFWRMASWWGVRPADDVIHIGHWAPPSWRRKLSHWPTTELMFDAVNIDEADIARLVEQINRHRPPLIEGYVAALDHIADFILRTGTAVAAPVAVGTTASPMTPALRARIESAFGAPAYDQYRSAEVRGIAAECSHQDGLHVFADEKLVEILDDENRPVPVGEEGAVVVTDLTNRVFPLIRYRIGDRGRRRTTPCPCGIGLPLMDPPAGRETDLIRLPSGAVIASGFPLIFEHDPDSVEAFQLQQHEDWSITLRVVHAGAGNLETAESAGAALREMTRGEVAITVESVDRLPMRAGKTQYVISDLRRDAD